MLLSVLPLLVVLGGQAVPAPQGPYRPLPDPKAAIATAIKNADIDDIRVLINWGTNDERGRAFAQALNNPMVRATRFGNVEYKVVNVDVGALDRNVDLAASYGAKLQAGNLPALTVLDDTGKVLAQATASDFRSAASPSEFDPAKIAAFFTRHQAPAPDAVAPFEAAVKQAKRDGRTVFVWFSAPW